MRQPATGTELARAIEAERLPIQPVPIDVDYAASVTRGVAAVLDRSGHIDDQYLDLMRRRFGFEW